MLTVLLISLLVLLLLNVPIGVCLGAAAALALAYQGNVDLMVVAQRMVRSIDSTTLLAIPLFIFAGKIMERGGISRRLVDLAYSVVGWVPGSLAIVTVLSCMFFAALSGSAPATVIAIGAVMAPMMISDGYPPNFSVSIAAAAGCIGVIIPPSIPFVNYAVLTGVSISDMFVAGIVPGLLMGLVLILYCFFMAKKHKWGKELRPFRLKEFLVAFRRSVLALLMPLIILGGIYSGFFTPTEAACVACVYGVVVAAVIYREITFRELPRAAFEGGLTNGMIMLIIGTAAIFSWILTTQQVPVMLRELIMGITDNPLGILMILNIMLLINGCFMELTASTFIYIPIVFPLVVAAGIDPVQFGIVAILNMTLGLLTPPLGVNLFIAKGIDSRTDFNGIIKSVLPMFALLVFVLLLVTFVPSLSTGLIDLLGSVT
ncbi:MAG: TRAP transporter large permease [Clostridiales Family XIII bacterium]|jgi:C4-dicarboxylate transporter DctM subunit|nr:TRAP transporter large permease [Clostridiales Family XIII bacterium]